MKIGIQITNNEIRPSQLGDALLTTLGDYEGAPGSEGRLQTLERLWGGYYNFFNEDEN